MNGRWRRRQHRHLARAWLLALCAVWVLGAGDAFAGGGSRPSRGSATTVTRVVQPAGKAGRAPAQHGQVRAKTSLSSTRRTRGQAKDAAIQSRTTAARRPQKQRQQVRTASDTTWKARGDSRDVSAAFGAHYHKAAGGARVLPAEARQLVYLLVPGAMGHQVPMYMSQTQKHLRGRGLEVHRSRIKTTAGVLHNARVLKDEVLSLAKGGRKVVLVTHSKGGIDALAADALYPEIRGHVRSRVLMQPPYRGSPFAEVFDNPVSRMGLRLIGGSARLVRDLGTHARSEFSQRHPFTLTIPTVTLATSFSGRSLFGTVAAMVGGFSKGSSDGVVPESSQLVPGTHVVKLKDMDHAGSIMKLPGARYQPGALAEALIAVSLDVD